MELGMMLKIRDDVDYNELDKYKDRFTFKDDIGYFLYNSLSNPTKILNIYQASREVIFINGHFAKADKLVCDLEKAGLVEKVSD